MRRLALFLVLAASSAAQPVPGDPDLVRSTMTVGLPADVDRMAVDAFGHVFINRSLTGDVIHVSPSGAVDLTYFAGQGLVVDLARNPADGSVYALSTLVGLASELWRFDAAPVSLGTVSVGANAFTFDDQGTLWFAGQSVFGGGIHQAQPGGNITYFGAGHANNDVLLALRDGSLLIGSGLEIRRFVPGMAGTLPFYIRPLVPNQFSVARALTRSPFSEFGPGVLLGFNDLATIGAGSAVAVFTDLSGGSVSTLVDECCQALPMPSSVGILRGLASGWRQDLYWLSNPQGSSTASLFRVETQPGPTVPGSLLAGIFPGPSPAFPTQVEIDLYGPAGAPFLLGAVVSPASPALELIAPPYGVIGLNPLHPSYLPIVDGLGLFVPPQALGVVPANGRFDLDVPVPLGSTPPALDLEAVIASPLAPNEVFFVTNVASL